MNPDNAAAPALPVQRASVRVTPVSSWREPGLLQHATRADTHRTRTTRRLVEHAIERVIRRVTERVEARAAFSV